MHYGRHANYRAVGKVLQFRKHSTVRKTVSQEVEIGKLIVQKLFTEVGIQDLIIWEVDDVQRGSPPAHVLKSGQYKTEGENIAPFISATDFKLDHD